MWWMMLGCGMLGGGEPSLEAEIPDPPASKEVPADASSRALDAATPVAGAVPSAPDLAGQWVVVVASATEASPALPDLSALTTLDPPMAPMVLDSSAYTKLAPCLKVAIAAHTTDRKAIFADLKVVRDAGFDAYVKPVGEATGLLNTTDDRCLAGRAPQECPGGVMFAETWGEHVYVPVGFREEEAESALKEAGALVALDEDKRAWARGLSLSQAGSLAKGSPMTVTSGAGVSKSCTVTRFVGLVRGQPHFGYLQQGDATEPGCGEPIVAAELDCALADAAFATKGSTAKSVVPAAGNLTDAQRASVLAFLEGFPAWVARKKQAEERAAAIPAKLETKVELEAYTLGQATWVHARVTALTGEGIDYCGMDEIYESGSLILMLDGELIKAPLDMLWVSGLETVKVYDVDGDGVLERRLERFGDDFGPAVIDARNQPVCHTEQGYCDSPC